MNRYRKRPLEIEAIRFTEETADEIRALGVDVWAAGPYHGSPPGTILWADVKTLEGTMVLGLGDWLIRGIKGELYPCKADIFDATYEPVDTPAASTAAIDASTSAQS